MLIIDLMKMGNGDNIAPLRVPADNTDRLASARSTMMRELVDYLQAQGLTPQVGGHLIRNELLLISNHPSKKASVRIWTDWPDYGPVHNGLPVLHYRLQVQQTGSHLSMDERATTTVEAGRVILLAFGLSRPDTGGT